MSRTANAPDLPLPAPCPGATQRSGMTRRSDQRDAGLTRLACPLAAGAASSPPSTPPGSPYPPSTHPPATSQPRPICAAMPSHRASSRDTAAPRQRVHVRRKTPFPQRLLKAAAMLQLVRTNWYHLNPPSCSHLPQQRGIHSALRSHQLCKHTKRHPMG